MADLENPTKSTELLPETKVSVVASLDDLGGAHYYLKSESGRYFLLNQDLNGYEEANEDAVASAILKHGYIPNRDQAAFEFGNRFKILKKSLENEPPQIQ